MKQVKVRHPFLSLTFTAFHNEGKDANVTDGSHKMEPVLEPEPFWKKKKKKQK